MRQFSNAPYSLAHTLIPVLYVVRHGSTGDDDSYNSPENPHLDAEGLAQAEEVASFLQSKKIGSIVASKHHRTVETAKVFAKHVGKKVELNGGLDSLDVG